jgi:hypothetical protein
MPDKWLHFDALITKRFYLEKYQKQVTTAKNSTQIKSSQASSINANILTFQNEYVLNYKKIQQKWVKSQQSQLKRNPFSLNPFSIVKNSFVLLGKWIPGTVLRRFNLRTMPEVQAKE